MIADAVADVVVTRVRDPAVLRSVVMALPPVAGRLRPAQSASVDWAQVSPEALSFAALSDGRLLAEAQRRAASPAIRTVLAAAAAGERVPPLADLESLAPLVSRLGGQPPPPSDDQIVYLLPAWPHAAEGHPVAPALAAAVRSAVGGPGWYVAALLARAVPYLDDDQRSGLRDVVDRLPGLRPSCSASLISSRSCPVRCSTARRGR